MTKRPALKGMRFWSFLLLGTLAVGLAGVNEAQAAFGVGGATCTAQSKTAGTTLACTVATENLDAGNVAVLWFAGDNTATVDGNDGLLSSVSDSAGNVWTVQRCFTNSQGTAATGATTCVATSKLTTTLTSGSGTITATFASITAKAIVVKEFTVAAGSTIEIAGTPQDLANDGADPGSMTISGLTASTEYLFVRATALERASGGTWTVTASHTTSGCNGTTGGGAASNMETCGEFRILTATSDTSDPTGSTVDNASTFIAFKEAAGTTLGNGTDPANASLAPGGAATMADTFTFQTSTGTDTITAVVVGLATGTSGGLSFVEITNDGGTTVYGSVTDPASDTPTVTLSTNTLTATTTQTQYKIRITPKSHAAMPVPPGSTYSVTAKINSWTGTNTAKVGTDTAGTTITIDNLSPGNVTAASGTAGDTQVALTWTNPADADLNSIVVLRDASAVADTPVEGATYSVGGTIGTSVVRCVVTPPTASCTDTSVINGDSYHYKIFTKDNNGNYSATGVVPTGSPFTPAGPGCYSVATGNWSANSTWASAAGGTPGTCPGSGNVPDSSTPAYINFTTTSHTVTVDITTAAATLVRIGTPGTGTAGLAMSSGTLDVGSSVTLVGGTGTKKALLSFTTGTLKVGGTITESGATDVTFGTGTVEYDGTGAQSVATYNYYNLTINKSGGTATTSGNITIGNNLTITTGTLNIAANSIDRGTAGGTFTLGSGALLQIAAANLPANYTTVSIATNSTVEYNPSFNMTVPAPGGGANYGNLLLSNSGNRAFNAAITVAGNLTTTGTVAAVMNAGITVNGNVDIGSGTSFDPKAYTHTFKGNYTNNGSTVSDATNTGTIVMNGTSAQAISGSGLHFYSLTTNNSAGVTTSASFSIAGNFTNTAGFGVTGTPTTTFNGTAAQTIAGATAPTFYNLTLNNTAGLTLSVNTTVSNTLTFSNGRITTDTNTLILSSQTSCGVSGAGSGKYVIGKLRKRFVPTTQIACTFEVGDNNATTHYTPLNVSFAAVSVAGSLTVAIKPNGGSGTSATADDHPQVDAASLDSANSLNRYWMLAPADGLTFSNATLTFTHLDDATWVDHDNSAANVTRYIVRQLTLSTTNPADCYVGEGAYNGAGNWNTATGTGTQTGIETKATGVSSFGTYCSHFAIGRSVISSFLREREFVFQREINY